MKPSLFRLVQALDKASFLLPLRKSRGPARRSWRHGRPKSNGERIAYKRNRGHLISLRADCLPLINFTNEPAMKGVSCARHGVQSMWLLPSHIFSFRCIGIKNLT